MRSFIVGIVIGAALFAAILVAPRFLRSGAAVSAASALEQAELARRELHHFDPRLPLAAARGDLDTLKQADLEQAFATERVKAAIDELTASFSAEIQAVRRSDQKSGLAVSELRAPSTGAGSVSSTVAAFESLLNEQRSLLGKAESDARAAVSTSRSTPGVAQVQGMVKFAQAQVALSEVRRIRTELRTIQAKMVTKALEAADYRSLAGHFAGLDVASVKEKLEADLADLTKMLTDAQAEVTRLTAAAADRRKELDGLRDQLRRGRAEMLTLKEMGFTAGDDQSFNEYKQRLSEIAARLSELQTREHRLANGGLEGATYVGGDLDEGEIQGGDPVIGLEELERQLAVAQETVTRYADGQAAIRAQIETIEHLGGESANRREVYDAKLKQLTSEVAALKEKAAELSDQAIAKEDEALSAAGAAQSAFVTAKSAEQAWVRDARDVQSALDAQRTNERLKQIIGDAYPEQSAETAEAEANTLIGRIQAERVAGLDEYRTTLSATAKALGQQADVAALDELITQSHDAGVAALDAARAAYDTLAQGSGNSVWVFRASVAVVDYLYSRIDAAGRAQHLQRAVEGLRAVVDQTGQSPFAAAYRELYDRLSSDASGE